ncbi:hypothetical protein COP2_004775 [Malus domestica]
MQSALQIAQKNRGLCLCVNDYFPARRARGVAKTWGLVVFPGEGSGGRYSSLPRGFATAERILFHALIP